MNKPYLYAGLGLLALAAVIGSCGIPVTIKTGSLSPDSDPNLVGCYTSGTTGNLVTDPDAGTAIIEDNGERRIAVTWPIGWTGRRSWFGVEVLNKKGEVVTRTGTHVSLMGGYWYVDDSFLTCGPIP
jgi:hypothetical protein